MGTLKDILDVKWFIFLDEVRFLTWLSGWIVKPLIMIYKPKEKEVGMEGGRYVCLKVVEFLESAG